MAKCIELYLLGAGHQSHCIAFIAHTNFNVTKGQFILFGMHTRMRFVVHTFYWSQWKIGIKEQKDEEKKRIQLLLTFIN